MNNHTRHGSALVIATMLVVILGGLAISLTETTVGGLRGEQHRSNDLALAMASESAANIALDYLQRHSDLLKTDLSTADKRTNLPTRADVDARRPNSDLSPVLGINKVHGMPVGARWCYVGQRAVVKIYIDGTPRLDIVPIGTLNSMTQDVYYVRAWATQGSSVDANTYRRRFVELLFVPYPQEVFVRAMFAHHGYNFQGAATTDSWDSAVGSYKKSNSNSKGDLGSEGDIDVLQVGNVKGVVNDFINFPLPPIEDKAEVTTPGGILTGGILYAGEYRYAAVNIGSGIALTIDGIVKLYVNGPVNLSAKSFSPIKYSTAASKLTIVQLDYEPADFSIANDLDSVNGGDVIGAPITVVYVDSNGSKTIGPVNPVPVDSVTGTRIEVSYETDPQKFTLISAFDGEMKVNGNGMFSGVLYAPNATIKMNGNFNYYGSVIANAFASKDLNRSGAVDEQGKIMGTFSFHYDEALARLKMPLPGRIGVVGWYTTAPILPKSDP